VKIVLDTNCFIYAEDPEAPSHDALQEILRAHKDGQIKLSVSRHTLFELQKKPDAASARAEMLPILPYWPIGTWGEQVGTWSQLEGTWDDARRNDEIQEELKRLAKAGNDIRDRGALLDGLLANADAFVTCDKQLVGSGPAARIYERFGMRILTPSEIADELRKQKT